MKKLKHLFSIVAILLCIVASFAWMKELDTPVGRYIELAFQENQLVIASNQLEVQLLVQQEDEQFKDITQMYDDEQPQELFTIEDFEPGERKIFKVKLKNKGKAPASLEILLNNISSDSDLLTGSLLMGTMSYVGFRPPYQPPQPENYRISERLNKEEGSLRLTKSIMVPPTAEGVEIQFYIFFDRAATSEVAGKKFTIGTISFLIV